MNPELLELISHPLVQERRGLTHLDYDCSYCPECDDFFIADIHRYNGHVDLVWLPLLIDPINPERGVWEWIDWSKIYHSSVGVDENEKQIYTIWITDSKTITGDPPTVLLKVFLYQQGVEV